MIPTTLSITEIENAHTSGAYGKRPLTLVRGDGCTLYDESGNAYLDMASGIGVAALGHNHPALVQAITQQAQTLITCPEFFYNDVRADLYALLADIAPGDLNRAFLCNSGTEAVEASLKVARLLTDRTGIIATNGAFHGRTMGSLGATYKSAYRKPFSGWTIDTITHVPFNDLAAMETAINEDTAAVLIEPIQGEGGIHPATIAYLQGLRELCRERGVMLIVDEIQCGMGRTGRWFAFERANILPDIVILAKGLAGGMPMGAVIWRDAHGQIPTGTHGSTFGGNPLACAAAIATITTIRDENLMQQAAENGAWFVQELEKLNLRFIREIRGQGLMVGIELRGRVTPILQKLQAHGIIALPAGKTTLRLLPPLIISRDDLQHVLDVLADILS